MGLPSTKRWLTVASEIAAMGSLRDAFAPGFVFPLVFILFFAAPYLNLVDYSALIPPPGLRMALISVLGLAGYLGGLWIARWRWPTASLEWPRIDPDGWRSRSAFLLLVAVTLVSLALLALVFWTAGMIPLLAANREAARFAMATSVGNRLNAVTRLPITAAIGCGLYLLVSDRRASLPNVIAAALVALSIVGESLLGHRGLPFVVVAPLFVCFHYAVRPIGVRTLAWFGGLVVVGLALVNHFRLLSSPPQLADVMSHSNLPVWMPAWCTSVATLVTFGPLTFNFVLSTVPAKVPFQHGMALFNGAFGILPGHQPTVGEFVSRNLFGLPEGSPNLPPTILGGFYLDFGVAGMVISMFLIGLATQFLYWRMFRRRSPWSMFFYAYWYFNLLLALYGDFIANDLTWFVPLSVYGIDFAARLSSTSIRSAAPPRRQAMRA